MGISPQPSWSFTAVPLHALSIPGAGTSPTTKPPLPRPPQRKPKGGGRHPFWGPGMRRRTPGNVMSAGLLRGLEVMPLLLVELVGAWRSPLFPSNLPASRPGPDVKPFGSTSREGVHMLSSDSDPCR